MRSWSFFIATSILAKILDSLASIGDCQYHDGGRVERKQYAAYGDSLGCFTAAKRVRFKQEANSVEQAARSGNHELVAAGRIETH